MKLRACAWAVLLCSCRSGSTDEAIPLDASTVDSTTPHIEVDAGPLRETCNGTPYEKAYLADSKLCLNVFATGLQSPRQMAFAPNEDLFVAGAGTIRVLHDDDKNGVISEAEADSFAQAAGLNHSVVFSPDARYVYASSDTTVYRWAYTPGDREAKGAAEVVIRAIPTGGHVTRTLLFDPQGRLYVSIGSVENVDKEGSWPTRAMIRRYNVAAVPAGGMDASSGEVFASGLRNEVGLHLDSHGRIWGVENGRDNLDDPTFGSIVKDNPGEEINQFDIAAPGKFYGYPLCWTEGAVDGGAGRGTSWPDLSKEVDPSKRKTTGYCRDEASVVKPKFAMQAHWAPLGIVEYTGRALPWKGDLFVASHGSWNRSPATGRLIARAHVNADGSIASVDPIVAESDGEGGAKQGSWEARPVDVRQGPDEALYFSDDAGGRVFRIGYRR